MDPASLTVADFNRDGNPDLAVANRNPTQVSVLAGNGAGSFGAATNFSVEAAPNTIAAGDFNRDGNPDLVTVNSSAGLSVLLGNGAGNFAAADNTWGQNSRSLTLAVADLNRDGILDIALANVDTKRVWALQGNGQGHFPGAFQYPIGSASIAVKSGDVNGDGIPDIVAANYDTESLSVLLGSGMISHDSFSGFDVSVGEAPRSIAMADFNGDGKLDMASANWDSPFISGLKNTGGQISLPTQSIAPASIVPGTVSGLLMTTATHNGLQSDSDAVLSSLHLGFTDNAGTTMTSTKANHLISALSVWRDANENGVFDEASDTQLVRRTHLELDWQGRLSIQLPATADTTLPGGTSKGYFVVVQTSENATGADSLRIVHATSAGKAWHSGSLSPLVLEQMPDISSAPTVLPVQLSRFLLD